MKNGVSATKNNPGNGKPMLILGLTGPTGSGKAVVSGLFASFGIPTVDTDAVYRDLLVPPSACLDELRSAFGDAICSPDGTLNRPALAKIVFSDRSSLDRLNRIAHRHILAEAYRRIDALRDTGVPAVLLDAPQLYEAHADADCDAVIAVLADRDLRLRRIMDRDKIPEEDALLRMSAHQTDEFFRSHADYILENNSTPDALLPAVRNILVSLGIPCGDGKGSGTL